MSKITLLDNPQIFQGPFSTSGITKEKVETGLGKPESMGIISPAATILLLGYSSCKYTCDMSSLRNVSHQRDQQVINPLMVKGKSQLGKPA